MTRQVAEVLTVLCIAVVDLVSVGREAYADDEGECDPDGRDHEERELAGRIRSPAKD